MMMFDEKGNPIKKISKGDKELSKKEIQQQNAFIEKLLRHLNKQEVELPNGSMVSNMDAIIENLVDKAIDGDIAIIKLIRDLLNNK